MRRMIRIGVGVLVGASVVFGLGCGTATNNDQGVSVTLLGYFSPDSDGLCTATDPKPLSGAISPISDSAVTEPTARAGEVSGCAGVLNNLSGQFIRTQRIYMDYFIPGASVQPPSTSFPMGAVVGPATGTTTTGSTSNSGGSSLPPSFTGDNGPGNFVVADVAVVPVEVMAWINLNRNSLPELPFTMTVTSHVRGVTSAGDVVETNDVDFAVTLTPDNIIAPTDGTTVVP